MIPQCKLFRKIKEMPCGQRWDKVVGLSVVDQSGSMQSVVEAPKLLITGTVVDIPFVALKQIPILSKRREDDRIDQGATYLSKCAGSNGPSGEKDC